MGQTQSSNKNGSYLRNGKHKESLNSQSKAVSDNTSASSESPASKVMKDPSTDRRDKKFTTVKEMKNLQNLKINIGVSNCNDLKSKDEAQLTLSPEKKANCSSPLKRDDIFSNHNPQVFQFEEKNDNQNIEAKDNIKNYTFLKVIGKGNFGKVCLVKSNIDGEFYAIKEIKKDFLIQSKTIANIMTEKRIMENINHPFIIKLNSCFKNEEKLYFVFDYCNGGELFFHLQKKRFFQEKVVKFIAAELYLALKYLHSNGIIYRDIKPENIILDKNGDIRLIDFGLAKDKFKPGDLTKTACGTSEYLRMFIYLIN
jgi:tRNA A-37 threonylcarbamoyl transferase component Bud32